MGTQAFDCFDASLTKPLNSEILPRSSPKLRFRRSIGCPVARTSPADPGSQPPTIFPLRSEKDRLYSEPPCLNSELAPNPTV